MSPTGDRYCSSNMSKLSACSALRFGFPKLTVGGFCVSSIGPTACARSCGFGLESARLYTTRIAVLGVVVNLIEALGNTST
jgi:hypothetical protein